MRSGTSPGITAGRSWGRPMSAARRPGRQRRAPRSPVARVRAPGPRVPEGAEVVRAVPAVPTVRALPAVRPLPAVRLAEGDHRPAVPPGQPDRRARVIRNAGDGTRAPGSHPPPVGRRQPETAAGASPAGAVPAGPTTWGPAALAGSWATLRAAACSRRRDLSHWPDDRCGTPTSGRPARAAEPDIAPGPRGYGADPWVTPSMSRR
jgi:hypothetical protein